MGGTFQATAGFWDSDISGSNKKVVLRFILGVIYTFQDSNSNLVPPMIVCERGPTNKNVMIIKVIFRVPILKKL